MATRAGTWDYREAFGDRFARTYFRRFGESVVSSIGLGTYLGEATDAADDAYYDAIVEALESGINVVDTAVNYRHQRSERVVGRALDDADVDRESVVVATKGGFVPFDGERPDDPGRWIHEQYVEPGLVERDDLVRGQHCIAPDFIEDQLDRSLSNLGLDAVDCYYVHNPETQLAARSRAAVYDQLEATFTRLEERAAAGELGQYGVATWEAFRVPEGHDRYLSLAEVVSRARAAAKAAGNTATHFRAIQLPFNVVMADAFTVAGQRGADGPQSALWFAHEAGLDVFASAVLAQGDLVDGLPGEVAEQVAGETSAQRAINFARSGPGVTCALVGMGSPEHVAANVAAGTHPPLGADAFDEIFE
mgnify:CR=1 FL=1